MARGCRDGTKSGVTLCGEKILFLAFQEALAEVGRLSNMSYDSSSSKYDTMAGSEEASRHDPRRYCAKKMASRAEFRDIVSLDPDGIPPKKVVYMSLEIIWMLLYTGAAFWLATGNLPE